MQFEQAYKGFYRSRKDNYKAPVLKNSELHKLINYEAVQQELNYLGCLNENILLVDVDNKLLNGTQDITKQQSKKLIEILKYLGIDTPIIETEKGHHFLFYYDKKIKSLTNVYSPIGIRVDYKAANNHGWECLKVNGVNRIIVNDTNNIAQLPLFLLHNPMFNKQLEKLENGTADNGRNTFLYDYKFILLKNGYSEKDVFMIISLINDFLLYEPVDSKELSNIIRVY